MTHHDQLPDLIERVSAFTGIRIHADDATRLRSAVAVRERAIHCHDANAYLAVLAQLPDQVAQEQERRALSSALIPLESFFFRDAGQVALLRTQLLPACIRARSASRTLRLWSAGCSTGEEAYTLAMLMAELLPARAGWTITIIGSDINPHALQRARAGIYPEWSFRGVPDSVRASCFLQQRDGWEILPALRDMVIFCEDDLQAGAAPPIAAGEFDLILCRNVLMYYRDDALPRVVDKLTRALAPHGRLLVAHNELSIGSFPALARQVFPESAVYRHSAAMSDKGAANPVPAAVPLLARSQPVAMPKPTERAPTQRAPTQRVPTQRVPTQRAPTERVPAESTVPIAASPADALRHAWELADQGALARANACCEQLLASAPLQPGAYYLLAHLAQDSGDLQRARALLEKVIYLEPQFVMAYFELGALYSLAGEHLRASRMRHSATRLLERLPADATLGTRGELTAGELMAALKGKQNAVVIYS